MRTFTTCVLVIALASYCLAAPNQQQEEPRAAETARLKIKSVLPLAAAGIAKVLLFGVLKFFGLIALVVKAVLVSKLALAVAVIVFSRLFSHQPSVTYEIVSQPHHASVSDFGSSHGSSVGYDSYASSVGYGHGRSGQVQDKLAYNAHVPK